MSELSSVVALWGNHADRGEDIARVRDTWPELAEALDALVLLQIQQSPRDQVS